MLKFSTIFLFFCLEVNNRKSCRGRIVLVIVSNVFVVLKGNGLDGAIHFFFLSLFFLFNFLFCFYNLFHLVYIIFKNTFKSSRFKSKVCHLVLSFLLFCNTPKDKYKTTTKTFITSTANIVDHFL